MFNRISSFSARIIKFSRTGIVRTTTSVGAVEPCNKPEPKLKTFHIYRYDGEKGSPTYLRRFDIDLDDCGPMILDALLKIKIEQDSTLTFRRSCREGVCGSCAMNIDGINRLACTHKITPSGITKIRPLPHMYVLKDLVVDMSKFFEQHRRIKPYLIRTKKEKVGKKQFLQSMADRDKLDGHIECILCACCATSCPEYWWHGHGPNTSDFLGPAALLNALRWIKDSRDQATEERYEILRNYYAVYRCHTIMNCTSVCPKKLNPGLAIAQLRLLLSGIKKKDKPEMDPVGGSDDLCKK